MKVVKNSNNLSDTTCNSRGSKKGYPTKHNLVLFYFSKPKNHGLGFELLFNFFVVILPAKNSLGILPV